MQSSFENNEDFDKHAIEIHGGIKQLEANFEKIHRFQKDVEDVESMVFGNTAKERQEQE
jgi:archaellum component FlaC